MKPFLIVLASIAGLLVVLIPVLGWIFCTIVTGVKHQSLEDARKWQEEHYDISWYDPLEKTDYTVESYDGYVLHVQFLKNPAETKKYVLITHGYTDNRFGTLKYAKMYLELGFHVIIYDLRAHGLNEKTYVSYSVRESRDLSVLIADCRSRYPEMESFGIHGESLGAATSAAVMKYRPEIDFAVCDCGFSEIKSIMADGLRRKHIPVFFVGIASFFSKLRRGISFDDMCPADSLPGNQVPMLFIHGAEDGFIPPSHSEIMHRATGGYSELHLIDGAKHAGSILTAPDEYREITEAFLVKTGVLPGQTRTNS